MKPDEESWSNIPADRPVHRSISFLRKKCLLWFFTALGHVEGQRIGKAVARGVTGIFLSRRVNIQSKASQLRVARRFHACSLATKYGTVSKFPDPVCLAPARWDERVHVGIAKFVSAIQTISQ
jgi:hypothetical protein